MPLRSLAGRKHCVLTGLPDPASAVQRLLRMLSVSRPFMPQGFRGWGLGFTLKLQTPCSPDQLTKQVPVCLLRSTLQLHA